MEETLIAGRDVILEIDWQGAQQIRRLMPDSISIFILPPSLKALQERLQGRGQDDSVVIEKRMAQAHDEIAHYTEADYLVVNDVFDKALADLTAIIRAQTLQLKYQLGNLQRLLSDLLA